LILYNIPANSHINLKEQCKHDEIDDDNGFIIRHFGTKDDSTSKGVPVEHPF
jgi:hypothetical protein